MSTNGTTKPLTEHFTIRLDEDLLDQIEAEAARRELEGGFRISRNELVRLLLRVGLATMRGEDASTAVGG